MLQRTYLLLAGLCLLGLAWYGVIQVSATFTSRTGAGEEIKTPSMEESDAAAIPVMSERKRRIKGALRMSDPDRFAEFHKAIRTRVGHTAPDYPVNYQIDALEKAWAGRGFGQIGKRTYANNQLEWLERGPSNVAGRARAILVDPDDPTQRTWFVGSASGGVWKTEDAGQSWINLTNDLPNLATTTLAMPASNSNVIYAGTGEGYGSFSFVYGHGIWKSVDKGTSWTQLPATASDVNFTNVLRVIVDPLNEDHLLAATSTGLRRTAQEASFIMRSTNGGDTWEQVYSANNRVEQVLVHPDDFQIQYATVNGQGILKSMDAGLTWTEKFDNFFDIGRLEMAIAPSNPNRLVLSAEGGLFPATLYISSDAGESWEIMDNIANEPPNWLDVLGWYSNAVAIDPFDENKVFVGGIDIYQFDIDSESFTQGYIKDVEEFDPSNLFTLDLAVSAPSTAYRIGKVPGISTAEFVEAEIRWGPGMSQKAHRFVDKWVGEYRDYVDVEFEVWDVENNRQLMTVFEDEDQDGKWDLFGALNDASERIFVVAEDYSALTPHGPTTENAFSSALYVVTVTNESDEAVPNGPFPEATVRIIPERQLFRESITNQITDGYSQTPSGSKGVHVDHHFLTVLPTDQSTASTMLLDANDGGIAVSYDQGQSFTQSGDTFSQLTGGVGSSKRPSRGLNTAQFYGVDKMNGGDRYIGGTQDNGSWVSPALQTNNEPWRLAPGGDGFEVAWHYKNPDWLIYSTQFNRLHRSKDGGVTWTDISPSGTAVFLTRLAKSNQRPDLIFTTTPSGVARSDDFGSSWERVDILPLWPFDSNPLVRISLASPDVVWAGASLGNTSTVYASQDGGQTFSKVAANGVPDLGLITNIATHPNAPSTAYALFSFANAPKILKTEDLGQTWTDVSGFGAGIESTNGFPDVAVYSLLVMPHNVDNLWAGTEIGIFESIDGGQSWQYLDSNLPAVAIWEMRIVNDQVVAATHGRGVWTVQIPELATYEPTDIQLSPFIVETKGGASGQVDLTVDLRASYDSTLIFADGQIVGRLPQNTDRQIEQLRVNLAFGDQEIAKISAWGYINGQAQPSFQKEQVVFSLRPAASVFVTDFENAQAAFILDGLVIDQEDGFGTTALHSAHPYPDFKEATALLRTPILVSDDFTKMYFDEIAFIEPGETDAVFGTEAFYDFAVVEGSTDNGFSWQPLIEGYDVRYAALWASENIAEAPLESQFQTHEIDLASTFQPGEEVLIRFRMMSDNAVTGWGWVVDNLRIQSTRTTSTEEAGFLPTDYALLQNYPNPFRQETTLSYHLPEPALVTLSLFDINGRLVQHIYQNHQQPAGTHQAKWDGSTRWGSTAASGVYFYKLEAGGSFQESRQLIKLK